MTSSQAGPSRWERYSSSVVGTLFLVAVVFLMLEGIPMVPLAVEALR